MVDVEVRHGSATDVGRVREVNEDARLTAPPVFVVADGMGGHHGGEDASRIVVEHFAALAATLRVAGHDSGHDSESGRRVLRHTLRACQAAIVEWSLEHGERGQRGYAGTTAVVALMVSVDGAPQWLVANLGDSRAYRLHGGRLEQVTRDHSLVQDLVDAGRVAPEAAAAHPESHVVTRALGGPDEQEADYFLVPMPSLDRLLLCTDGVTDMVDDRALQEILASSDDPHDAANRVVSAALVAGGEDNATAVVVDVVGCSPAAPGGAG